MKRLVALAVGCALIVTGVGVAEGAKPRTACAKTKLAKQHRAVRCARVRRLVVPRAAAERLSTFEPGQPAPSGGSGDGEGDGPEGGTPPAPPAVRFVSVKALEYSLTLSRPLVNPGSVTVELRNNGEDPHDLVVSPDDGSHTPLATWADTAPGTYARQTVTLAPGRYQLWCSLLDHESRGMTVDLVVE